MVNNAVFVGRIKEINEINQNNNELLKLKISVPRSYKNSEGQYDSDIIPTIIKGSLSQTIRKQNLLGGLVGIKGTIESDKDNLINIIAQKVTFLSSGKLETI